MTHIEFNICNGCQDRQMLFGSPRFAQRALTSRGKQMRSSTKRKSGRLSRLRSNPKLLHEFITGYDKG